MNPTSKLADGATELCGTRTCTCTKGSALRAKRAHQDPVEENAKMPFLKFSKVFGGGQGTWDGRWRSLGCPPVLLFNNIYIGAREIRKVVIRCQASFEICTFRAGSNRFRECCISMKYRLASTRRTNLIVSGQVPVGSESYKSCLYHARYRFRGAQIITGSTGSARFRSHTSCVI